MKPSRCYFMSPWVTVYFQYEFVRSWACCFLLSKCLILIIDMPIRIAFCIWLDTMHPVVILPSNIWYDSDPVNIMALFVSQYLIISMGIIGLCCTLPSGTELYQHMHPTNAVYIQSIGDGNILNSSLLEKMAAISQKIFSDAFSRMKSFEFWLKLNEVCS